MLKNIILLVAGVLFSLSCLATSASKHNPIVSKSGTTNQPQLIEWTDLMLEEDIKLLEAMTPVDHDSMSDAELEKDNIKTNSLLPNKSISKFETSSASNSSKKRTWRDALVSAEVRPEYNNVNIKLAGYVVPLDFNATDSLATFFFVPYFGACIHVPPPPPNQIIYIRYPKGLKNFDMYTPYWITGTLRIETVKKDIGLSSYALDAASVTPYTETE